MMMDHGSRYPDDYWTRPRYDDFRRLLDAAKVYDTRTGQPDCEDPEKVALLKRIEDRLIAIEKRLDDKDKNAD